MKNVGQLIKNKGSEVWSVSPTDTVLEALKLMSEKNIGAVPVIDDGKITGMFSERDYARKVILFGKASKDTYIHEVMSSPVFTVKPDSSVRECMEMMTEKRIRHIPVVGEGDNVVGLISIGDVVKTIMSEQEAWINQLEDYITSKV